MKSSWQAGVVATHRALRIGEEAPRATVNAHDIHFICFPAMHKIVRVCLGSGQGFDRLCVRLFDTEKPRQKKENSGGINLNAFYDTRTFSAGPRQSI